MEVEYAAEERQQTFRDPRGDGAIVFDAARMRQAAPGMLEAEWWGDAATPVVSGGRGAAWFVRGPFGEGVLRRYRRGGAAARFSQDRYLWLGAERVRSVAEFRLLAGLRALGLPVPAPLLAGWWRRGATYRAAILVERIAGARALAGWLGPSADAAPWESIGATIARFHRNGLDHADLNAHNILVDADERPWLIDLDRSRRRAPGEAWVRGNLARLQRSLAKLSPDDDRWRPGYSRLLATHAATLAGDGA